MTNKNDEFDDNEQVETEVEVEWEEDDDENDLSDAETILTLGWDPDGWGSSGAVWLVEKKGKYYVSSSDYDTAGPFDTLDEALGEGCFYSEGTPNPELSSATLDFDQLAQIARNLDPERQERITIEGVLYCWKGDELVEPDPGPENAS